MSKWTKQTLLKRSKNVQWISDNNVQNLLPRKMQIKNYTEELERFLSGQQSLLHNCDDQSSHPSKHITSWADNQEIPVTRALSGSRDKKISWGLIISSLGEKWDPDWGKPCSWVIGTKWWQRKPMTTSGFYTHRHPAASNAIHLPPKINT